MGRHLERRELRVLVIRIMAAGLIELDLADVGRVHRLVASLDQLVLDEALEDAADDRPLGHPEDQPRPDQLRDRVQIQLAAEPAMVAFLGFLELGELGVELFLVEERRAVNALKHVAVGPPFPVGPGDREQLVGTDLAGVGNMRAAAEVDELTLPVEAQHAVLVQLFVDMLDLERLPQVGDELAGFLDGKREPLEWLGVLEDAGHLGLDRREIVFRQVMPGHDNVVIKAVCRGRTERELDARIQPHDGPRHDVGRRMAQDVERLAILGSQDPHVDRAVAVFERSVEIDDMPAGHRRDGHVGQSLADRQGDVARADRLREIL